MVTSKAKLIEHLGWREERYRIYYVKFTLDENSIRTNIVYDTDIIISIILAS